MALFKPRKTVTGTIAGVIDDHMRAVRELFRGDTKLTLVVRSEDFKGSIVFTNDEPDAAIGAIRDMSTSSPNLKLNG